MNTSKINNIPLNIYQTYKNNPPEHIKEAMNILKSQNPEFNHYFFDDTDISNFIKKNFHPRILKAFNILIPGAYKADLFRYCILYKYGGIYLDAKLIMDTNKKLIDLVKLYNKKEFHVLDFTSWAKLRQHTKFIYQGFMISEARNPFLKNLIIEVVNKILKRDIGKNPLDITGPNIYWKVLKNNLNEKTDYSSLVHKGRSNIYYNHNLYIKCHKIGVYNQKYEGIRYFNMWPKVFNN